MLHFKKKWLISKAKVLISNYKKVLVNKFLKKLASWQGKVNFRKLLINKANIITKRQLQRNTKQQVF